MVSVRLLSLESFLSILIHPPSLFLRTINLSRRVWSINEGPGSLKQTEFEEGYP